MRHYEETLTRVGCQMGDKTKHRQRQAFGHLLGARLSVRVSLAIRAIIDMFCILQDARQWLFQPLAQVNNTLVPSQAQ